VKAWIKGKVIVSDDSEIVSQPNSDTTRRRRRGQGLVEFALILPLLLLFLLGVIEVGRMLAIYSSVSSASRQAARYGSVVGDSGASSTVVIPYYEDCAGMRRKAQQTSLLQPLAAADISIRYDKGLITQTVGSCPTGAITPTLTTSETIKDGYRVVISITTTYKPLVPIVPLPTMVLNFQAAHTIFTTIIGPTNEPPPNPDVLITKHGTPLVVSPNGILTYWITATNNITSGVIAQKVTVTDTLPVSVTLTQSDLDDIADFNWTCTFVVANPPQQFRCTRVAPLAAGQSAGFSYEVQVPLFGGVTLTNTTGVTSTTPDVQPSNNFTYTVHPVLPGADLQAYKTVSPSGSVGAGTLVTYSLWVNNNGGDVSKVKASQNDYIWITDTLPTGVVPYKSLSYDTSTWFCMIIFGPPDRIACRYSNDLGVGLATPSVTLVITAPTTAGTITNTLFATPSSLTGDPLMDNNTVAVTSLIVTNADLAMAKFGPATADSGTDIPYTLHVTNNGPSVAVNVRVTDTLPAATITSITMAGWTSSTVGSQVVFVYGSALSVGATTSNIVVHLLAPNADTPLANTAEVGSSSPDQQTGNNTVTVTTVVNDCHQGIVNAAQSTVSATPTDVLADNTSTSRITVTLRDKCGVLVTSPAQLVTLTSLRGVLDTITPVSSITSSGTASFDVKSGTTGTSTYSATAQDQATLTTINITATTQVNYYGCAGLQHPPDYSYTLGLRALFGTQPSLQFIVDNTSGQTRRLTGVNLTWPQTGSRAIESVTLGPTATPTTIWTGSHKSSPFNIPSGLAWNGGTDAARTLANGTTDQTLQFNFSYNVNGTGAYNLTTTWDDGGGGHVCTATVNAIP